MRRQGGGLALGHLGLDEGVAVARRQGLQHRVFGRPGLQQGAARLVRPPRPARGLGQQLIGPLGRAQVAAAQAQVRVHHPDQGQAREVVALGRRLGGHQDVDLAVGHALYQSAGRLAVRHGVRAEDGGAGLGEELAHLLLDPLDARPDRHQRILRPA
ncbi:hypothetical protein FQZ97_953130 [compost metagenome]